MVDRCWRRTGGRNWSEWKMLLHVSLLTESRNLDRVRIVSLASGQKSHAGGVQSLRNLSTRSAPTPLLELDRSRLITELSEMWKDLHIFFYMRSRLMWKSRINPSLLPNYLRCGTIYRVFFIWDRDSYEKLRIRGVYRSCVSCVKVDGFTLREITGYVFPTYILPTRLSLIKPRSDMGARLSLKVKSDSVRRWMHLLARGCGMVC